MTSYRRVRKPKVATNGAAPSRRARLGLVMMVRDEEAIIERAVLSALPYISAYYVTDTGSEDRTKDIIRNALVDVPGLVEDVAWEDFAANRTKAIQGAAIMDVDYFIMMDADQTLEIADLSCLDNLEADAYNIQINHDILTYPHPWLLRKGKPWFWRQETHEYLDCSEPFVYADLAGVVLTEHADSHRRLTGIKVVEDRKILDAAYEEDPNNARTVFYLGQLCFDEGRPQCALTWYKRRVEMGGWIEEVWAAQYRIGMIYMGLKQWEPAVMAFMASFNLDGSRAEPLYRLGRGELAQRHLPSALLFFTAASGIAKPVSRLFLEPNVYDFAARWGSAMTLRLMGRHEEAEAQENIILGDAKTPARVTADILESRISKAIGKLPI